MNNRIDKILSERVFTKESLVELLNANTDDTAKIFAEARKIKKEYIGNKVHLRGLIELTNYCTKNCYYCGIASGVKNVNRYMLSMPEVEQAIRFIHENHYGGIVIQSGELQSEKFVSLIEEILHKANSISGNTLGITLSCGEQIPETYKRWKDAGAHRYLLRIEASNRDLYYKLHPRNKKHDFETRVSALYSLKELGYQTGTGVMIGLPFQTVEDLASDLLFMRDFDIDMCGMGPYIEHEDTPLYKFAHLAVNKTQKVQLSLKMIAILRIMMKDINIAATTAMQTLINGGREMALKAGANILMPNTTPGIFREHYSLYKNKPGLYEEAADSKDMIEKLIQRTGSITGYGEKGNAPHYYRRCRSLNSQSLPTTNRS